MGLAEQQQEKEEEEEERALEEKLMNFGRCWFSIGFLWRLLSIKRRPWLEISLIF